MRTLLACLLLLLVGGCGKGGDSGRVLAEGDPLCPAHRPLLCEDSCPAQLEPGDQCRYDTRQCCVCTSEGQWRCSNGQPDCPWGRDEVCPFDGALCHFCDDGELTAFICSRGAWAAQQAPACP